MPRTIAVFQLPAPCFEASGWASSLKLRARGFEAPEPLAWSMELEAPLGAGGREAGSCFFLALIGTSATHVADGPQRSGMEGDGGALGAFARHGAGRPGPPPRRNRLGVHDGKDDPRTPRRQGRDPAPPARARGLVRARAH